MVRIHYRPPFLEKDPQFFTQAFIQKFQELGHSKDDLMKEAFIFLRTNKLTTEAESIEIIESFFQTKLYHDQICDLIQKTGFETYLY